MTNKELLETQNTVKITTCGTCKHGALHEYTDGKLPVVFCNHKRYHHYPSPEYADWFCPCGEPKDEEVKQDD